jgi:hypothetical protein
VIAGRLGVWVKVPTRSEDLTLEETIDEYAVFDPREFAEYAEIGKGILPLKEAHDAVTDHLARYCLENNCGPITLSYVDTNSLSVQVDGVESYMLPTDPEKLQAILSELNALRESGVEVQISVNACYYIRNEHGTLDCNMQPVALGCPRELIIEDGMFIAKLDSGKVISNIDYTDRYLELAHQMALDSQSQDTQSQETPDQSDVFDVPQIGL